MSFKVGREDMVHIMCPLYLSIQNFLWFVNIKLNLLANSCDIMPTA